MNRRSLLKFLGTASAAVAVPATARELARLDQLAEQPLTDVDLAILKEIIERNELPWERMRLEWEQGKK